MLLCICVYISVCVYMHALKGFCCKDFTLYNCVSWLSSFHKTVFFASEASET